MLAPDRHRQVFPLAIRDGLAPAALVCGVWYAALVPVHLRGLTEPARVPVVAFAAATAAVFFLLAWLWRRHPPSAERTDRAIAGAALLILLNNTHVTWYVSGPVYLVGFYLELLALGVFILSHRWFAGLVLAVLAGFALGPLRGGWSENWRDPTIAALGSAVLATLVHASLSTYRRRLEGHRRESEARGFELEQSLERLRAEVSHRERLQAQLARAERLESLGLLAGGIAHDFNNLLAIVVGNASLGLGYGRVVAPELRESLEAILAAGDRAQLLSGQLLAYAGRRERRPVALDLGEEVRAIVDLARRGLPAGVTLELEPTSARSIVFADRAHLQQVVSNLVANAADATRHAGGGVRVRLGESALSVQAASELEPAEPRPALRYAYVRVCDDGCGMDAETLAHIFDPFFSTKGVGRGLGLAAALGIARSHGGGFSVESEAGRGTVFTLFLPETDALPETRPSEEAAPASSADGETTLVVDDDEGVRATAARALRAAGHRVVEAAGGREATELLRSTPEIALAVVDMTMPGMSGEETLHALRALRPDLPVLLSSGYDVHEAAVRLTKLPGVEFLAKPYRASEIAACAQALLDERPPARGASSGAGERGAGARR